MEAWKRKQDREDYRIASIQATLYNVQRTEKSQKVFTPFDFFTPRSKQTETEPAKEAVPEWKNQLAMVEMLNAAFGGKDLRAERRAGLVDARGNPIQAEGTE